MSSSHDPFRHHRRSIRLGWHDYATAGAYFITICTADRECLLGEIVNDVMVPSDIGKIAEDEWMRSAHLRQELELDAFVIMPNHLHGIVTIIQGKSHVGARGARPAGTPRLAQRSVGAFIAGFKSSLTRRANELLGDGVRLWQRNYYEHIVRNERELDRIRAYIEDNPRRWSEDEYYPKAPE